MAFCVLCSRSLRKIKQFSFCSLCEEAWQSTQLAEHQKWIQLPQSSFSILSHYAYRGVCRESILAFKGRGFRPVGRALAQKILTQTDLQEWMQTCDVIMPAPSSLWSRWHGSLDLAAYLAESLAVHSRLLVKAPPFSLGFRWHKQALRRRGERKGVFKSVGSFYDANYFSDFIASPSKKDRLSVLIVDDVVTTGNTLAELVRLFKNVDFKFYTLASAFRFGENTGRTLAGYPDTEG